MRNPKRQVLLCIGFRITRHLQYPQSRYIDLSSYITDAISFDALLRVGARHSRCCSEHGSKHAFLEGAAGRGAEVLGGEITYVKACQKDVNIFVQIIYILNSIYPPFCLSWNPLNSPYSIQTPCVI